MASCKYIVYILIYYIEIFLSAPIIKGVDVVNGESQNKVGDEEFDDIELDGKK